MNQVRIYLDEDAMDCDLVGALRSRDVFVTTALEADLIEKPDEDHLRFATENGYALYTFNVSDFLRLHSKWAREGQDHCGMILAPQQRLSIGDQLRGILHLRNRFDQQSMFNQAVFLTAFLGDWADSGSLT